jgi:hypothetical protein
MADDVQPRHYRSDEFETVEEAEWEYWGRQIDRQTGSRKRWSVLLCRAEAFARPRSPSA